MNSRRTCAPSLCTGTWCLLGARQGTPQIMSSCYCLQYGIASPWEVIPHTHTQIRLSNNKCPNKVMCIYEKLGVQMSPTRSEEGVEKKKGKQKSQSIATLGCSSLNQQTMNDNELWTAFGCGRKKVPKYTSYAVPTLGMDSTLSTTASPATSDVSPLTLPTATSNIVHQTTCTSVRAVVYTVV